MVQIDVHLFGCQSQVHGGHAPGAFDAQDAPVKLTIFHADWMAIHAHGVHSAGQPGGGCTRGVSAERFETPSCGGSRPLLAAWGEPSRPGFPPEGETGKGEIKLPCCRRHLLALYAWMPPSSHPLASPYSHSEAGIPALLAFVLRVVALASAHLLAIERVHGGVGI